VCWTLEGKGGRRSWIQLSLTFRLMSSSPSLPFSLPTTSFSFLDLSLHPQYVSPMNALVQLTRIHFCS